MSTYDSLELIAADNVRLVSVALGLSVYTEAPISSMSSDVLSIYDEFLSRVGESSFRFYATENMRSHKPVRKSTLSMLPTWLKAGAPSREYISIEMKDGEQPQDAPRLKFHVHGIEAKGKLFQKGRGNAISMAMPIDEEASDYGVLKDLFVRICSILPIRSGSAGFVLECSRYDATASETHAWAAGMRMRGLDICRIPLDCQAVGVDGLKGVGWLTALGNPLIEKLGGVERIKHGLPSDVTLIETPRSAIIQAGDSPQLGDVNRPDTLELHREVYRRVKAEGSPQARGVPEFVIGSGILLRTCVFVSDVPAEVEEVGFSLVRASSRAVARSRVDAGQSPSSGA